MEENRKIGLMRVVAAIFVGAGILGGGFFIGNGIYSSRMNDKCDGQRAVRKDVTADLAVWNLNFPQRVMCLQISKYRNAER